MSESPHELIRELKIRIRADVGLPDYDPSDPTLSALPSLAATIATLDPSEPHLRCKHCKGRFISGSQSIICVYCGRRPEKDVVPDPICFNSTIGYRWLLRSLHLDGSELVKPPTNETEKDQGQGSSKAEISLSDFLNFKVAWSAETEDSERSLIFTGVDPNNFFFKIKSDASDTFIREPIMHAGVWNSGTVTTPEIQNLDHGSKSYEMAVNSSKPESSGAFSAWEAEFQSADSGGKVQDSSSFGFQNLPSVSISSHNSADSSADSGNRIQASQSSDHVADSVAQVDSAFEPKKDTDKLQNNPPAFSAFDQWDSDDVWKNLSSKKPHLAGGSAENNEVLAHHPDSLSTSFDLFQDFQGQSDNTSMRENMESKEVEKTVDGGSYDDWNNFVVPKEPKDHSVTMSELEKTVNEDAFDEWDNFTGSTNLQDPSGSNWLGSDNQLSTSHENSSNVDLFSPSSGLKGEFSNFRETNAISTPTSSNKFPTDATFSENPASNSFDLFQDFQQQPNNSRLPENSTSDKTNKTVDEESSDDWNDFTVSNNLQDPSVTTNEVQITVNEDSFDEWNYFTATNMQNPSGSEYQLSTSQQKSSETEFQDFQLQPNNKTIPESLPSDKVNKTVDEDSFQDCDDFTGSNNMQGSPVTKEKEVHKSVDEDSFDEWNSFTDSTNLQDSSIHTSSESESQPPTSQKKSSETEFQDFQSQPNNTRICEDKTADANERVDGDSISDWNDFTSANNLQDPSLTRDELHKTVNMDSFDEWNYLSASFNMQYLSASKYQPSTSPKNSSETEFEDFKPQPDKFVISKDKTSEEANKTVDGDPFSDWKDFNLGKNAQTSSSSKKSSEAGFQDFQVQPNNIMIRDDKTSDEANKTSDDTSSYDWNDFTGSNNLDSSLSMNEAHKTVHEDSFDEWNYFTTSTNKQNVSGSNDQPSTSDKKLSETELFSEKSGFEGDFSSFPGKDLNFSPTSNNKFPTVATSLENPAFKSVDLFLDFQWQPTNKSATENVKTDEAHKTVAGDSFDRWNNFAGPPILNYPSGRPDEVLKTVDEDSFDEWSDFTGSTNELSTSHKKSSEIELFGRNTGFEGDFNSFPQTDLVSSSNGNNNFPADSISTENTAFNSIDFFQGFQWLPSNSSTMEITRGDAHKKADKTFSDEWNNFTDSTDSGKIGKGHKTADEDSFDEWNDFADATNNQDPSGTADKGQKAADEDSFDEWNDFTGSANFQVPFGITAKDEKSTDDDPYDEWNDFTSSPILQDPSGSVLNRSNNQISTSNKKSPEIGLFSSNSGFEGELSIFAERNPVSTSTSNSNFPKDAFLSVDPIFNRLIGASKPPNESSTPKSDAMMLISQMHDVSFMFDPNSNTRNSSR